MKTTKYIASFMYFVVLLSFIFLTAYFIIGMSAKFFGNDGQYIYKYDDNSWTTIGQKNSEGSLVPVHLTLEIPDSIKINTKYFATDVEDSYPPINNIFLKENKKTQAINIYEVNNFSDEDYAVVYNENYKNKNSFKFIKYEHYGDSQYLSIKSNDKFTDFILALRSPISFLFYILQMYF